MSLDNLDQYMILPYTIKAPMALIRCFFRVLHFPLSATNPLAPPTQEINDLAINVLTIFFIVCSLGGLATAAWILAKTNGFKRKIALYLGLLLLSTSTILLELNFISFSKIAYVPKIPFFRVNIFLFIPFFFLYLHTRFFKIDREKGKKPLIHLIPFAIALMSYMSIQFFEPPYAAVQKNALSLMNNIWIRCFYVGFYLVWILYDFVKLRMTIIRKDIKLLLALITSLFIIWLFISVKAEVNQNLTHAIMVNLLASLFFCCFILLLAGQLFINSPLAIQATQTPVKKDKYKNSALTPDMSNILKEQLLAKMESEQPFLDSAISLTNLAKTLNTDRYSLSQVINENFSKNFYEFINDYRIAFAQNILEKEKDKEIVVSDLIFQVGFNNKVSFYKAFKKRTGKTPLEYHKQLKHKTK
ncbi:AraC family transcriptional regulator [Flavobacterium sp. ASW18X]|uniref:helix-turn-helix domain-containing protein n=1 Tax=Flavobacterium sp. ASW18X TaxID=2572595 RepID=UPI0010ADAA5F|nr:helix-turn-helix domain-containing protein [Flavobacterium sp. ASW18X]